MLVKISSPAFHEFKQNALLIDLETQENTCCSRCACCCCTSDNCCSTLTCRYLCCTQCINAISFKNSLLHISISEFFPTYGKSERVRDLVPYRNHFYLRAICLDPNCERQENETAPPNSTSALNWYPEIK